MPSPHAQPGPLDVLATGGVPALPTAASDDATVDCAVYADGARLPGELGYREAVDTVRTLRDAGRPAFVWLGLHEPDERQMHEVAAAFGLHSIPVEDAVHAQQRPKVQRYDQSVFVVLKTVNYVPHESVATARRIAETGEVMVFAGVGFVVAVRHGRHSGLAGLRRDLEADPDRLSLGPFGVLHAIAGHVVDGYLRVTHLLEADIDAVEEEIFAPGRRTDIEQIYTLKRDVLELRRAIGPLTPALETIATEYPDLIPREVARYLRDLVGHQMQAAERIVAYDDMLSDAVEAALARVGMQQNVDMRRISAWVAIAAVPTMIAGIYGMNFESMPELSWPFGYPAVLALMVSICLALYLTFRRNNWL